MPETLTVLHNPPFGMQPVLKLAVSITSTGTKVEEKELNIIAPLIEECKKGNINVNIDADRGKIFIK